MTKLEIHNFKRRIEVQLKFLEQDKISDENKKLIRKFYDEELLQDENVGYGRQEKYIRTLRQIALQIKKDLDMVIKEDITRLMNYMRQTEYSDAGKKREFKVGLSKFYKWLRCEVGYPKNYPIKELRGIKTDEGQKPREILKVKLTKNNNNHKIPKDYPTEEEVLKLIENANRLRDKCLISLLYESGCRIAEILTLQRKNVEFGERGAKINVSGKTGEREVWLFENAVHYLIEWFNRHPYPNDLESPLFVTLNDNRLLPYDAVRVMIKKLCKKAKLERSYSPHDFRHARANVLANSLTEAQMCDFFGWTQGSRMPSIYITKLETKKALMKTAGLIKEEEEKESPLKARRCPRCDKINSASAKYCEKCWMALDVKTAMEVEQTRTTDVKDLMKGLKEVLEKLPQARKIMANALKK